ncbi:MAG TPA: sigma-70 family RNA polymerase sigma factor [Candidatus Saccharimonadales bacterium]|nr:sigma-70 family RNA polymerase sigma factor [Candidatus Saccharimonadales bacterium]
MPQVAVESLGIEPELDSDFIDETAPVLRLAVEEFDDPAMDSGEPVSTTEALTDEPSAEELESIEAEGEVPAIDGTKTYMKGIGRVALLNAEEEVTLAKRIEAGLMAGKVLEAAAKPSEERDEAEQHLANQYQRVLRTTAGKQALGQVMIEGRQAYDHLTEANLRLVISVAKRYQSKGMEFDDLIQEGNFGLFRAVEKFDYTKGYKFSTYATWWIKQALQRAIAEKSRLIDVPVHMNEHMQAIDGAVREIEAVRGVADAESIGQLLFEKFQKKGGAKVLNISKKDGKITVEDVVERVRDIQVHMRTVRTVSMDKPVGDEKDTNLGEFQPDTSIPDPEARLYEEQVALKVREGLAELDDRTRLVVEMRNGFHGAAYSLDEVGKILGLTRERIRQIQRKGEARLKASSHINKLRDRNLTA